VLDADTTVKERAISSTTMSPLTSARFIVKLLATATNPVISEIHLRVLASARFRDVVGA
jgi:hypothetical protein